jgi:hypothetical protein
MSLPPLTLKDTNTGAEREKAYRELLKCYEELSSAVLNFGCFITRQQAVELREIERAMHGELSELFEHVSHFYDEEIWKQAEHAARSRSKWESN